MQLSIYPKIFELRRIILYTKLYATTFPSNPLTRALDNHVITTIAYLAMLAADKNCMAVRRHSYMRFGNLK